MILNKLRLFLDDQRVKYTVISHSQAFTAHDIAATAHISGRVMAKTVIVNVDGKPALAVVPATDMVDLKRLKKAVGATRLDLAGEIELNKLFPECEIGAMPPFGNLYNMPVFVAQDLAEEAEIVFNAGTHLELIKMTFDDFRRLVNPLIFPISVPVRRSLEEPWDYRG